MADRMTGQYVASGDAAMQTAGRRLANDQSVHRVNIRYKIGYEESVDKVTRAAAIKFRDEQLTNPEVASAMYIDPETPMKTKEKSHE